MHFDVTPEVAFDYLVDPRNRPEWQSSLVRVEDVTGEPQVGQRWVDVTKPGLRSVMETTELDRPNRWSEKGTWRGLSAVLTLEFAPAPGGCEVEFAMKLDGPGLIRPVALLLNAVSPLAVRSDLKRAEGILSRR